jgi:hypothetical protein
MMGPADIPCWRVVMFLDAMRAVWLGRACLTSEGAAYLGVPFTFRDGRP